MRSSKLWVLALLGWLWPALAFAQLITPASMRDANLTTTSTQNLVTTLNTFSAQRTLTIPGSGALSAYYFQFVDTANAINGANTLRIVAADGALINGGSSLTVSTAGAYVFIISSPSGYAATIVPPTASGGSGTPGGSSGQVQYNNAGAFGGISGATSNGTAITLVGPILGTPASGNLANTTGYLSSALSGAVPVTLGGTGGTSAAVANITAIGGLTGTPSASTFVRGDGTWASPAGAGTVTTTGSPASGNLTAFSGATSITNGNLSGDVTTSGTLATTLASTITAAGPIGSATVAPIITYDAKGRLTTVTSATITPAIGSITGAGTGCITWLTTPTSANLRGCLTDEVGTGAAYFVGGALGTPASGTATNLTGLPLSGLTTQAADTAVVNATGGAASPTAVALGSCSAAANALTYNTTTHAFGCNTISAGVTNVATAGLATGGPITGTGTVTVIAATKSDQQTGTSAVVAVTPSQAQSHASAAKAWATFQGTTAGCPATVCNVFALYNVSGVTRTGTGTYQINFTTAFASVGYTCAANATSGGGVIGATLFTKSVGNIILNTINITAALTDTNVADIVCFGAQ